MKDFVVGDNLAFELSKLLGFDYLKVEERIFSDGEVLPKLEKEPKINQAILIYQKKQLENINSYLIKYLFLSKKLKEISQKVIGVMPYYPYARQDAVFLEGEPVSSLYLAQILEKSLDIFITCNPHEHRQKLSDLFTIPAYNVSLFKEMSEFFNDFDLKKTVLVAPDREAKTFIDEFSQNFSSEKYVFLKQRNAQTGDIEFLESDFDFRDKEAIIVDDVLSTGKTLLEIAQKVKNKGTKSVSFVFVHLLNESAMDLIKSVSPKKIITTNTLENRYFKLNIVKPLTNFLKENIF
ncbi:MAG TPA: ribose-phosphate diphosphokinase [Candidatus Paceibacterota bacterium]|nr:ribose-phosphate diphosphokinase [Candidatus Paceibacterota bacterium]